MTMEVVGHMTHEQLQAALDDPAYVLAAVRKTALACFLSGVTAEQFMDAEGPNDLLSTGEVAAAMRYLNGRFYPVPQRRQDFAVAVMSEVCPPA